MALTAIGNENSYVRSSGFELLAAMAKKEVDIVEPETEILGILKNGLFTETEAVVRRKAVTLLKNLLGRSSDLQGESKSRWLKVGGGGRNYHTRIIG